MPKAQYFPLVFPQELFDLVLDYVIDTGDMNTLTACALAHRSLRQKSQQVIFREIKLRLNQCQQTSACTRPSTSSHRLSSVLRKAPDLASHIYTLTVVEEPFCAIPTALPAILPRLRNLTRLDLARCTRRVVTDVEMGKILAMPALEELVLVDVTVPLNVFDSLPRLRRLMCHDVLWDYPQFGSCTALPPTTSVHPPSSASISPIAAPSAAAASEDSLSSAPSASRHLTLSGHGPISIAGLDRLLRSFTSTFSYLTSLDVSFVHTGLLPPRAIYCLVERLQGSLEQLTLACPTGLSNIQTLPTLAGMPKLNNLTIEGINLHPWHEQNSYYWVFEVLRPGSISADFSGNLTLSSPPRIGSTGILKFACGS
ncbi:hypothetical protein BD626DRAFT_540663 [Schizophyllum amplum]|uniref:F-box domain-containing protein n=1 Tax=Schizophyllum amplum TaxID=97359 RepID=A0A550BXH8_9AGAR|nr:hypothetical protein BD626DRAFT_540663 [Auriculariopsis ampla]